MKFITIIFARMDSKRLPGKVLLNLAGRPVLDYVLDKTKKINISEIILATSIRKLDDPIADFAKNRSIVCFRGEFENVLDRAIQCAKYFSAECILRICGDSPFISFDLANYALDIMKKKNPNIVTTNCPRSWPIGSSIEFATVETLEEIQSKSRDNIEREHIFKFAYLNPQYFKIENIFNKNVNQQNIRLAIDTKEDLIRADWIIKNMPNAIDNYKLEDAIDKYFKYEILKRNC